jgi:hypothetical protein
MGRQTVKKISDTTSLGGGHTVSSFSVLDPCRENFRDNLPSRSVHIEIVNNLRSLAELVDELIAYVDYA